MSDLNDLSRAQIDHLAASLMGKQSKQVSSIGPVKTKLRSRRVQRMLDPIPGAGLNQTITLTVELPAYLVAGLRSEGDLNVNLRLAARDWLVSRGKTWWQPRYLAAIKAKTIERELGPDR